MHEGAPAGHRRPGVDILLGIGLALALHLLQVAVVIYLEATGKQGALPPSFIVFIGFAIFQLLYLVPVGTVVAVKRRWWMLLVASIPVAAAFQFILHGLLGIYIADPMLQALGLIR